MTYLRSRKLTQTRNSTWRRAGTRSSIIHAEGVRGGSFHQRRRRGKLFVCTKCIDSGRRARSCIVWRPPNPTKGLSCNLGGHRQHGAATRQWVNLGKQTRVNSRECRSLARDTVSREPMAYVRSRMRPRSPGRALLPIMSTSASDSERPSTIAADYLSI
jgi:hypothetical protein